MAHHDGEAKVFTATKGSGTVENEAAHILSMADVGGSVAGTLAEKNFDRTLARFVGRDTP